MFLLQDILYPEEMIGRGAGAMAWQAQRERQVVLFQSGEDEETLVVTATVTGCGAIEVRQVSAGELTAWCYEESPHEVYTRIIPASVRALIEHFHIEDVGQLVEILGIKYSECDCSMRIRALLRSLGLDYVVVERPITR